VLFVILAFFTANSAFSQQPSYPDLLRYTVQALKGQRELGTFTYTFQEEGNTLHILVTLSQGTENRKEAELWLAKQNGLPIRSRKWVYTPRGTLFIESNYYADHIEVLLSAEAGKKKAFLSSKGSVFDLEQLPFLIGNEQLKSVQSLPVLIPISGMIWKARVKKLQESPDKTLFLLQVAGEKLYLYYKNNQFYPEKIEAPQRGYQLVLTRVLVSNNQLHSLPCVEGRLKNPGVYFPTKATT